MACHGMLKFFIIIIIHVEAILDLWLLFTEGCASILTSMSS